MADKPIFERRALMKLVSVIVQAYNSAKTIVHTLDSVKLQTYPNIELIVTDDKSSDNTIEVVKNWINNNENKFIDIKIVTSSVNTGIPGSNNRALMAAKGEYVEFLAADDYMAPNAIEQYVKFCEENKCVIPISKVKLFTDDESCDFASVEKYCENCYEFAKLNRREQYRKLLIKNMIIAPAAAFYPIELLKKLKGFDERFWIEDYPINIKILRNGYKFGLLDEYLIYYKISGNSIMGSGNLRIKKAEAKLFFELRFWYLLKVGMVREALGQCKYWIKMGKFYDNCG
jgi:alpha-1,3-rhamnosyltransferase